MEQLVPAQLTSAGRAALEEDETQVATATRVSLCDRNKKLLHECKEGMLAVTTHHVWWWTPPQPGRNPDEAHAMKLPLQRILKAEAHSSLFRREPRIDLFFASDPSAPLLRFVFRDNKCAEVFERLQTSLARKNWEKPKQVVKRESGFNTQFAGVGGVMRRQQQEREQTANLTTEAFSDLKQLLDSASEIVKLADRFSSAISQNQAKAQAAAAAAAGGSSETVERKQEDDFFALLNDMGIANPATKRACGSRYHEELARELADFLAKHLKRHSATGAIALTDLYCLVNRARGTELISPNDLYQACILMKPLGLNFVLKTFESGVSVLQSISLNDDTVSSRFVELLRDQNDPFTARINAVSVASAFSLSLQLALEQLKTAEKLGYLCRDETAQGVDFYLNLFEHVQIYDEEAPPVPPPVPPSH
ncbi:Vacuolar protein sorting-associated protein 36 [Hondaea fermentalgiana]|uniref:Vacuolar protein-sorting-associated protein 36 n=1 Tax=Hondaea fermentalgiana TaxID=2315210 RepID=A0A2R5GK02_9STRA|nr:Vacuolar protein sorting-associated protein 36 [Hondaea fermentalgiana]|eukprot:GBG31232.1 Vacuolar protein sorting-associated protein 36 [Hondaea fermentalgiana]